MTSEAVDVAGAREGAARRRTRLVFVPPQHGAWAFLGLPLALGATVVTWTPLLAVLAVGWIAAYPMSYAAFGLVRGRRPERFRVPLVGWSVVVLPAAVILLAWRPWLIWVGLVYAALFVVNAGYARRNDERSLANDAVFVVECSAMVVVTWAVGAGTRSWTPPALSAVPYQVWVLAVVCALTLWGSTLHVKSLIRERGDHRYSIASRVFALASLPAALGLAAWWGWAAGAWFVVAFVALALRAFVVPGRTLRPGAIGVVELWCFVLVVVSAVLAGR